ncbi:hypothetical protein GCM10009617_30040 [Leifsonia poae]|uniref:Uncharacterized protein n=1 Tax=Leifsonia poae TaxID=110933 RepID=A0A9W6LZM7_9MICO|nr:hypothetical protein GCM10017584_19820 [Leifsonia poae]
MFCSTSGSASTAAVVTAAAAPTAPIRNARRVTDGRDASAEGGAVGSGMRHSNPPHRETGAFSLSIAAQSGARRWRRVAHLPCCRSDAHLLYTAYSPAGDAPTYDRGES